MILIGNCIYKVILSFFFVVVFCFLFFKPADSVGGVIPIETCPWSVCPCGRVAVRNRYFSLNFDSIATKISHNLDQTSPSPACARRDDLSNF